MGFKEVINLDAETTISLGGRDKKTGKANPATVEGYFLGTRQVPSKKSNSGFCSLHFLSTAKGNIGVWGKTDLDRKLGGVTPGVMIRVTFTGMQKTNFNDMYKFKVEVDADNTIDVSSIEQDAAGSDGSDGYDAGADEYEEQSLDAEEAPLDEVPLARPKLPAKPAATADAVRQAKVRELLNGSRNKAS